MSDPRTPPPDPAPPRAFTQGVGSVFQFVGVSLFLASMSVCCGSSLLGTAALRPDAMGAGWRLPGDAPGKPTYNVPRATTICLAVAVFTGLALAGIGLGLQAQRRAAPRGAAGVTAFATLFWGAHVAFALGAMHSVAFALLAGLMALASGLLFALAVLAWREMRADPPPPGHELLPADYQVPYSHMHQDPPEVRIARELEQRRERLAVQQKELELLEEKLRSKIEGGGKEAGD